MRNRGIALLLLGPILIGGSCARTAERALGRMEQKSNYACEVKSGKSAVLSNVNVQTRANVQAEEATTLAEVEILVRLWVAEEPEVAMGFLHELGDGQLRERLVGAALRMWAGSDIAAAADWATRNGGSRAERARWLRESVCGLAAVDAAEGLVWYALMSADVRAEFDGTERVAWERYLKESPADAAARIPELPTGELKNRLAAEFTLRLAAADRGVAQWWAEELADTGARDAALGALRRG